MPNKRQVTYGGGDGGFGNIILLIPRIILAKKAVIKLAANNPNAIPLW